MIETSPWALAALMLLLGLMATSLGAYALYSSLRNGKQGKLYYQAARAESEDVQQTLQKLTGRITALEAENARLQARLDQAEMEIERLERDNARLGSALRRLVTQVGALGKEPDIDPVVLQRLTR
jgi:septal ring factor EnvC (AmiA/AmiB activator)